MPGGRIFKATIRLSCFWRALYTAPIPPWPIEASISNWGNFEPSSSIGGGTKRGELPPVSVPLGNPAFSRHSWHKPWGEFGASGLPQLGHKRDVSIICYLSIL